MSFTLLEVGIQSTPVYIHKIDRPTIWKSEDVIEQRVDNAVARIFKDPECIYSFWRIESEWDFYCIASSLNSGRSSFLEEIHFIWVTDAELDIFGLTPEPSEEGKCLYAKKLHYNVSIKPEQAYKFCLDLMTAQREPGRCRKKHMKFIVDRLTESGCKLHCESLNICNCISLPLLASRS